MSKKRRQGGRVTPKGTRPAVRGSATHRDRPTREPSLIDSAGRGLRERSPIALLAMASGLIEAATERPADRWRGNPKPSLSESDLFESFVDAGVAETEALALAVAALHTDELLARRLKGKIEARGSVLRRRPVWLDTIDRIEVTDVVEMVDTLRDGDNVMVAFRWPDGSAATAVVYIDHNMGTIVKDAFIVPESFDVLMRSYELSGLEDQEVRPLDPATARARVTEAIADGERMVPPWETDTWPICRPFVEWVIRALPAGGEGYVRPEWSDTERDQLLADFVASSFVSDLELPADEVRHLAEPLVWFGCDYGPGDPLRWSPVSVEIVLTDWYPRKVFSVEPAMMRRVPDVVAALVRFAHDRRQIPQRLTDETVEAVARWTPDFLHAAARPGRSPEASAMRLARLAAGFDPDDPDDDWDEDDEGEQFDESLTTEVVLDSLERQLIDDAGGPEAYSALSDDPLPDEPFDWSGIPQRWHEATAATLARLDELTTELCDVEARTAARRVLAAVMAVREGIKQPADGDRLAVAIVWAMCRKWEIGRGQLGFKFPTQKELSALTGIPVGHISSRASMIDGALIPGRFDWTRSLHSSCRRRMLEARQVIAELRQAHADGE